MTEPFGNDSARDADQSAPGPNGDHHGVPEVPVRRKWRRRHQFTRQAYGRQNHRVVRVEGEARYVELNVSDCGRHGH
jgi:hypothetical protein